MFSVKSEEVVEDKNISLVNWQPDPEHPDEPYEEKEGDGWTVQQMYSANEKLGVHSSFTNIDMYSTYVYIYFLSNFNNSKCLEPNQKEMSMQFAVLKS